MLTLLLLATLAGVDDQPGIQDNSLLSEEAYNQDPGIVQHINFFQRDSKTHDWIYTFTQEWPVPAQKHQLSYTIPVQTGSRVGDVAPVGGYCARRRSRARSQAGRIAGRSGHRRWRPGHDVRLRVRRVA